MSRMNSKHLSGNRPVTSLMKATALYSPLSLPGFLIALICGGCAAEEDMDFADSRDLSGSSYMEEEAGSMAGSDDVPTNQDSGVRVDIDAESAGFEASDSTCNYLARLSLDDEEEGEDVGEVEEVKVCLDSLDLESEWCNQADNIRAKLANGLEMSSITNASLSDSQKESLDNFTCSDRDNDCYYVCSHWELPGALFDLDDRRSSITNDPELRSFADEGLGEHMGGEDIGGEEGPTHTPETVNNSDPFKCLEPFEGVDNLPVLEPCTYTLEPNAMRQVWSCENDHIAWLTGDATAGYELQVKDLWSDGNNNDSLSIQFIPEQLVCSSSAQIDLILLLSNGRQVFRVLENMLSSYNLSLDDFGLSDYSLFGVDQIQMNKRGVQWWSHPLSPSVGNELLEGESLLGIKFNLNAPSYRLLPSRVEAVQMTCTDPENCGRTYRAAYLTADNEVIITDLSQEEGEDEEEEEEISIFELYGPFKSIKSSDSLLGLAAGTNLENPSTDLLYFSLWTDSLREEDSLISFPLIFDPIEHGYLSVELTDIKGMNAMLRLTGRNEAGDDDKDIWAVYNALTDQLTVIDEVFSNENLTTLGLPVIEEARLAPMLNESWVSQVIINDDETVEVVVFKLDQ